jgi:hypothetical protein
MSSRTSPPAKRSSVTSRAADDRTHRGHRSTLDVGRAGRHTRQTATASRRRRDRAHLPPVARTIPGPRAAAVFVIPGGGVAGGGVRESPVPQVTVVARQTPPGARSKGSRVLRDAATARAFEGGPPELAGRPQEAVSNGSPRWMAAGPPSGGCTEPGLQADSSAAHSVVPEHHRSARQHSMDHVIPRTGRSTQLTHARVDVGNDGRAAGAHVHLVVGMFIRHIFLDDHGPAWLPDALPITRGLCGERTRRCAGARTS